MSKSASEAYAKIFYGFKEESGLDSIYHYYQMGVSKIISSDVGTHIIIQNRYEFQKHRKGNVVFVARKREVEEEGNNGRWLGWWDFVHKFKDVSVEDFDTLCAMFSLIKTDPPKRDPYYEGIDEFLLTFKIGGHE